MKKIFRMLALCCAAGLAHGQAPLDAENLLFTPPTNFKVGYQSKSSNANVALTEFVPVDQSIGTWTEMVTVQVFRAVPATANDFLQVVGNQYLKACPDTTAKGIFTGNSNGYVVSMLVLKCPNNPVTGKPETTIFRAIRGGDALYSVQHAWRAVVPDQGIDAAMRALGNVIVCDTRTVEHPCPALTPLTKPTQL